MMRILQITDTHLFADSRKRLLGINTQRSFLAALRQAKQERHQPDAILLTGDLSQDSSIKSYKNLAKHVSSLFKCPILWLPGNHDEPKIMAKAFAKTKVHNEKIFRMGNWQIILLNSHSPGNVHGYLNKQELKWLEKCLKENPDLHTVVTLHHHPIPVKCKWLDNLGLKNADAFLKIVDKSKQIRGVLWGHIHQKFETTRRGKHYLATPSTCIQFKPNTDGFALDEKGLPGFRWVNLKADGSLKTIVRRVKNFDLTIDLKSTGY